MPREKIDARKLQVWPLHQRKSYIDIERDAIDLSAPPPDAGAAGRQIERLAARILAARSRHAAVMLTYGAHLIKNGAGPALRELINEGFVTHLATQGAGVIHDWEFAFQGASSESVRDNAPVGRFGAWDETGRWLSVAVLVGAAEGLGLGEAVGRLVSEQSLTLPEPALLRQQIADDPAHELTGARADLLWTMQQFHLSAGRVEVPHPFRAYSVLAGAYEKRVPLTVHPGIGYDIIINHPMFPGGGHRAAPQRRTRGSSPAA